MPYLNRKYMLKLSEMDEEDAFDPADFSSEELFAMTSEHDKFISDYKAYYDDVKTGKKLHREDW